MKNIDLKHKYKNRSPEETIKIVKNFFKNRKCVLEKFYEKESEAKTYSCGYKLKFHGKEILQTNGKGTSKIFAEASCLGEMYERFCAFPLSTWNPINCDNIQNYLNNKEFSTEDLSKSDLEKSYLELMFSDLNTEIINEYLKIHFGDKIYKNSYKNINIEKEGIEFYSPLNVFGNTSNGFSCGNTLNEAIIQGISELYERETEYNFFKTKKEKYYFLNQDILPDYLKEIIKEMNALNYEVTIYDLSYNFKMPVCMILLINKTINRVYMHFGAFPIIDIAIERCLTEFYQGVINAEKEKDRKKIIPETEATNMDFTERCCFGGYQKEILVDNLFLNSQKVNNYNDLIFLKTKNYTDEDIINQINKINDLINKNFYYKDISLSKDLFAVHIISNPKLNLIHSDLLEELNDIYNRDKTKFKRALAVSKRIIDGLKFCIKNKEINEIDIINYLNDILLLIPINSIEERNDFLALVSYIIGIDLTNPYQCWNTLELENNDFLLSYLIGGFENVDFNGDTTFGKNLIPWIYFYLYCVKHNNSIENYNKIITTLGYEPVSIEKETFTPASFIKEAIIKNFQLIYNSEEYSEFINLFIRKEEN